MSTGYKKRADIVRPSYTARHGEDTIVYGKVTDVFTSTDNPELEGAIRFTHKSKRNLPSIAYPVAHLFQHLPLLGEVVSLTYNSSLEKVFYSLPINIYNYPTHNASDEVVTTTVDYSEPLTINPYTQYTGDTLLQGRFGQSIRFSQSIPNKTPWSGSIGNSLIVISSGQVKTEDGSFLITEDINQDPSSFYLAENINLPIIDVSKRVSYEEAVINGNSYQGNQAVLNSDRLYLNAREDSILLSAQSGSIGLSGNTINLDGINSIRLDAPSYNLQANNFTATNESRTIDSQTSTYNYDQFNLNGTNITIDHNRIALGQNAVNPLIQSNELMADITLLATNIATLCTALSGVVGLLSVLPAGQVPAAALQAAATSLQTQASSIQTKASSGTYLSTKAFTE